MPEKYISLQEAVEQLKVARGTLDYYLRQLKIERKKFPLDKRAYIAFADFERIKQLREEAAARGKKEPLNHH